MRTVLPWVVTVALLASSAALADSPRARFDVPQTISARDITTREFALVYPHERMIEARVPITMLLDRGPASDIRELVHRLESTTAGAQAVDYWPKTTLSSTIVGTTRIEREKSQQVRATADVNATYYGLANLQAHGDYQNRHREDASYEQLPSLDLLTASGTVDRGRGVYFKLKPSPRTTLEGAHDFTMVLRVPRAWRSGLLYVTSEARGVDRSPFPGNDSSTIVGRGRFVVAMYQQGDIVAQQFAQRYTMAEAALRHTAAAHRQTIERRTYPTALHKWGVTRDNALPRDWQETVIFRGFAETEVLARLPGDVRLAVETLLKSRQEFVELHKQPALAVN